MAAKGEKAKDKDDAVITAVYKVNLHCQQCARDIKKPLLKTQGVRTVDYDVEKAEVKVKGEIDVIKVHKLIERLSRKRVELVSPQPQIKVNDAASTEKKAEKSSTKQPILRTTSLKVHMHCDKCENDLQTKLLKHKDIYSVKTDMNAQILTVQGSIEPDQLLRFMRKNLHKSAEITSSKVVVEERKEKGKEDQTKPKPKSVESRETTTEFEVEKRVEVKTKEGTQPYFIHYVYAPQLFSDENPNACYVM
ncbi:hypothetical protein Tsubulata_023353 [Turnera subulata]|uniref:HMA domain-containing protein n=1 Tax=Turnera subulata TaxID=218843 RepID=A0A9Q0F6G2_9ROSI|nr:hypothetical protein Tsubulata_023353 [Turnera subulata]